MTKNTDKAQAINNIYLGKNRVIQIIEALEVKNDKAAKETIKLLLEKGSMKRKG